MQIAPIFLLLISFEVKSQNPATVNPFPCQQDAHTKEFDFWLGDWEVYDRGSNTLVGQSTRGLGSRIILIRPSALQYPAIDRRV